MGQRGGKRKYKGNARKPPLRVNPDHRIRQADFVVTVTRLAEPLCAEEGLELVHVECQREPGGLTVRVYLDKEGGVTLNDCVEVSRQLNDMLDVHLHHAPPYRLEVSSPGENRPVGKLKDFERYSGRRANIRTQAAVKGKKQFTGVLRGVVDEHVRLQTDHESILLPFDTITRARLINTNGEH